jgi:hypothetical protein
MIYQLDPLEDPRWQAFVDTHPAASVFHMPAWLAAIGRTYGYSPIAFTTSAPDEELKNGLLFCRVRSWLTGSRLVSLPFSDHCEPLCKTDEFEALVQSVQSTLHAKEFRYLELRPVEERFARGAEAAGFQVKEKHLLHRLDLHVSEEDLFESFHKDSIQRRVRHAERAGLVERVGRSETLLKDFYRLCVLTRKRQHLPPQPYRWFQNLVQCLGESLEIRVAYKDEVPVASIMTLRFRNTVYYKYGCSDARHNHLAATPLLFWRAICNAKSKGGTQFDFGRTEIDNEGLLAFKNKWAGESQPLTYLRFPSSYSNPARSEWKMKVLKRVFSLMPNRLLTATGTLLYRHIG